MSYSAEDLPIPAPPHTVHPLNHPEAGKRHYVYAPLIPRVFNTIQILQLIRTIMGIDVIQVFVYGLANVIDRTS